MCIAFVMTRTAYYVLLFDKFGDFTDKFRRFCDAIPAILLNCTCLMFSRSAINKYEEAQQLEC